MESLLPSSFYVFAPTSYPTALLFPTLPYYISLLPQLFRLLAFLVILPVLLLAGGDMIGWTVFKLVLRPLGYTSTIRFKDPEPSTLISVAASAGSSHDKATTTSSDQLTDSKFDAVASSPISDDSPSPISYTTASSTASQSPLAHSIALPSPTSASSSASNGKKSKRARRNRAASTSSTNSAASIDRARAQSVGVEGPLFGFFEDGVCSPGGSDRDGSSSSSSASENEEDGEATGSDGKGEMKEKQKKDKVPRGGAGFGMTKVLHDA